MIKEKDSDMTPTSEKKIGMKLFTNVEQDKEENGRVLDNNKYFWNFVFKESDIKILKRQVTKFNVMFP